MFRIKMNDTELYAKLPNDPSMSLASVGPRWEESIDAFTLEYATAEEADAAMKAFPQYGVLQMEVVEA